ncbi:MAG: NAD(P)-dependent oxidoreductase [Chitinophagaceae bacterium]|nr:NAD(P)-dependent oxidoreductase [Rubrivivax sp.]
MNRILLTGAAGKVARSVRPHIAALCKELRLTDIAPFDADGPHQEVRVADLADPAAVPALLEGVDAIVHFAGYPREAPWSVLLDANIRTVVNLWEAAAAAGVERIVYASSNHAVGYYPRSERIDARVPERPDGRYGATKVFMEAVAQLYADKNGLKAFGMRIGYCGPEPLDARMLSHWLHPEDLAQLIGVGLTVNCHHEIVYGISANSASWYDNARATAMGYRPRHSADHYAAALAGKVTTDPVTERYQGGSFAADGHTGDPERPAHGNPAR